MKFGVMVLEGPYQHQAADSAYQFIQAALARGHEIVGVFLYMDGVNTINQFISPPGERNLSKQYDELAESGIPVVACTACAKFRGLRPNIKSANTRMSGLGSLAGYLESADRFVTFGD
jgi:tRNA 2-thiouridine synthesizing protein D